MKHIRKALETLKIHTKRRNKNFIPPCDFVENRNMFRKNALLDTHIKLTTRQLFGMSHSIKIYNEFNIKSLYNIEPEQYLNQIQFEYYTKCLKFIPNHFNYFLVDYIASTDNKSFEIEPEIFLQRIGFRLLVNVKSSLEGFSKPICNANLYNTIPKPFSPLFFLKLQFADTVLKHKEIRVDFDECFEHLLNSQYKKSIQNIINSNSIEEINIFTDITINDFFNNWRISPYIKSKSKQVIMYLNNSFNASPIYQILIISYIYNNRHTVLEMSPQKIHSKIIKSLRNYIFTPSIRTIFEIDFKQNSYLFKALKVIHHSINDSHTITRPCFRRSINKYNVKSQTIKHINTA